MLTCYRHKDPPYHWKSLLKCCSEVFYVSFQYKKFTSSGYYIRALVTSSVVATRDAHHLMGPRCSRGNCDGFANTDCGLLIGDFRVAKGQKVFLDRGVKKNWWCIDVLKMLLKVWWKPAQANFWGSLMFFQWEAGLADAVTSVVNLLFLWRPKPYTWVMRVKDILGW